LVEYRLGEYSLCLSEGYKGEWAGLKKWQHWQKYKIGKLEEGSPNQEKSSSL